MNRKFVSILCIILAFIMTISLVLTVIPAFAVSQSQIDELQAQKDELKVKSNELSGSIADLKAKQADVIAQKEALDAKNELNRQAIELIVEQIDLYTQLIDQKAKEVEQAKEKEDQQLEKYKVRVRSMEEDGNYTYFSIIFNAKSLSDLITRIDMISEIMDSDKTLYDNYMSARENTEKVKEEYEATLEELGDKQDELETEKAGLEKQIEEAYQLIADLQEDIDEYQKMYEQNAAAEGAIGSQIGALTAQMKAEEEAARLEAQKNQTVYTGPGATATGSLIWPCPSCYTVTSDYGYRTHPLFGDQRFHSGIDIGAAAGASIVAADGGTVQLATYSSSYGNYVVVYHSSGLTTLYAHMSSIAVSAGQSVNQGDTIGYVGSTGWATGPHLHFEIRSNGSTVSPGSYFSYTVS